MKKYLLFISSIFILGMLLSGCATIVRGSDQRVVIDSTPSKATVIVTGYKSNVDRNIKYFSVYETPCSIMLPRKYSYNMAFQKYGYEVDNVNCPSIVDGAIAGNIVFGGILGAGIDLLSGSAYTLVNNHINLKLSRDVSIPDSLVPMIDENSNLSNYIFNKGAYKDLLNADMLGRGEYILKTYLREHNIFYREESWNTNDKCIIVYYPEPDTEFAIKYMSTRYYLKFHQASGYYIVDSVITHDGVHQK